MEELQNLITPLKNKGLTDAKIPIDVWCGIIEYFVIKQEKEDSEIVVNDVSQQRELLIDFMNKTQGTLIWGWNVGGGEKLADEYLNGKLNKIMSIKIEKVSNIQVEGVNTRDYPDFCDTYFVSAWYDKENRELTEAELNTLLEDYPEVANELAFESLT